MNQGFTANQAQLNRDFQQNQFLQNIQLQMALAGRTPQGPGALDYFLQALGEVGQTAGAYSGAKAGAKAAAK